MTLSRESTNQEVTSSAVKYGLGFGLLVMMAGAAAICTAPFLPFISVFGQGVSLNEMREAGAGSGLFTEILIIGGIAAGFAFLRLVKLVNLAVTRVGALIVGGAGLTEVAILHSRLETFYGAIAFDIGFYVLATGALAIIVGGLLERD